MADRAKKKEKHRLKREKKQQQVRKQALLTPLQHIARNGGTLECHITRDWKDQGIANIFVFGTAADGRHALSVFLIDLWCVGLKDVWGEASVSMVQYRGLLEQMMTRSPGEPIKLEVVKELVASAVRFSKQNGFKLPANSEKWTGILGDLGDYSTASLDQFGKDGGLLYVGTSTFLKQRLVGCTPEEFVSRPNVHCIMQTEDGWSSDEGEDNEDEVSHTRGDVVDEHEEVKKAIDDLPEEYIAAVSEAMKNFRAVVAEKFVRRRVRPHSRMDEALKLYVTCALSYACDEKSTFTKYKREEFEETVESLMEYANVRDRDSLWDAIEQLVSVIEADEEAVFSLLDAETHSLPPAC